MHPYPQLFPGDTGRIMGGERSILKQGNKLIKPQTPYVHHIMIGDEIPWADDYVILESIGKGIAVGRLSFYHPAEIEIYRHNIPQWQELGKIAAAELTIAGRGKYDYKLIFDLAMQAVGKILFKWKLPPYDFREFEYKNDDAFICTEAAAEGWRLAGFPIIPLGVVPTPAAFQHAIDTGKLRRVFP